jgi:hypothetical protein
MVATYVADHTVVIRDKAYLVTVYREAINRWVAVGDYMDLRIEVKAWNPTDAELRWVKVARDWDAEGNATHSKTSKGK